MWSKDGHHKVQSKTKMEGKWKFVQKVLGRTKSTVWIKFTAISHLQFWPSLVLFL